MRADPFVPQLVTDYSYFCDRFGDLPFAEFVAMWHAADALMEAAADAGYEPHEVPELLITANTPRMEFIRSASECLRPGLGRMKPRGQARRRWRTSNPSRA